ncbi:hypothetical protein GCM10028810_62680 [Spirosoma litoris]
MRYTYRFQKQKLNSTYEKATYNNGLKPIGQRFERMGSVKHELIEQYGHEEFVIRKQGQ